MEQVSKNLYKGEMILALSEVIYIAKTKKSIYHTNWGVKPAAIILSMQANLVHRMLINGNLFRVINKSDALLNRINEYIREEGFPSNHLQALHDIIVLFNWSDESEKEIFEFSNYLKKKYGHL